MKKGIILILAMLIKISASAQASLEVVNNSMRYMTVKVMRASGAKGKLYKTLTIAPNSSGVTYFSASGRYFTKTKAVKQGKKPICKKGEGFDVVNDDTGYSVLTLTFSITESLVPQSSGGKEISEAEFNAN
jgi:hypothetical protein